MPILDQYGKPFIRETANPLSTQSKFEIVAKIDNALTIPENQRNWIGVDYLSAKAANSFQVRRVLRIRSRYEVCSNPYLFGVVNNNADDLIDTGPTLQCDTGNKAWDRQIESLWNDWCAEIDFTKKLKITKLAKTVDGEGFLVLKTANDLEHPVKLYPVDIEADQVTDPLPQDPGEWMTDGVKYDPATNRILRYSILKYHPGDYWFPDMNPMKVEHIAAKNVVHSFLQFRPGQIRGLPAFTSSLDLFTEMRSFRKSTLEAAQTAANHSAVVETEAPPGYDSDDTDAENYAFRRVQINRNMMTVLPHRWKMSQFRSEHPGSTYEMFIELGLREAIRPLNYPLLAALGTSQKANFSSAKLDWTNYRATLRIERATECEPRVLEPMFRAFIFEASLTPGLLPGGIRSARQIKHGWHWPGFESLDPLGDAQADQIRLSAGLDTWQAFCARRGTDMLDHFAALSEAQKKLFELDIEIGEPTKRSITETTDAEDSPETTEAAVRAFMARAEQRREASRQQYEAMA